MEAIIDVLNSLSLLERVLCALLFFVLGIAAKVLTRLWYEKKNCHKEMVAIGAAKTSRYRSGMGNSFSKSENKK